MKTGTEIWAGGFVDEGAVVLRDLGLEGLIEPIPDEESAVLSLRPAANGNVYGLTHGRRSHLFVYNGFPVEDGVLRLGVVGENTIGGDLVCAGDGLVYGAVYGAPDGDGEEAHVTMFRYDPSRDAMSGETGMRVGEPEFIPSPFGGRRFSRLAIDAERGVVYGALLTSKVLFSYDIVTGSLTELGPIGVEVASKVLCVTDGGVVYGAGDEGVVFRLDPERREIQQTAMVAPCGKGKDYVNEVTAFAYDAPTRAIYGGTLNDGYLFRIELDHERVICLGKPVEQRPIRCLTMGADGRVFGVAGEPGSGLCHLFRYDPETGDLRDLGVPRSTITQSWVAHEIDAICTNRNGHIVMGENDRMSHLMVYYPSVRAVEGRRRGVSVAATG